MASRATSAGEKKAEAILLDTEKKYWNLFENSPLPVMLWDLRTGRFMDCNAATLAKYGYSRDEFLKLTVKNLWPPGDPKIEINEIISTIESDNVFRTTRGHVTKGGDIITVDISGQLIVQNGRKMALAMVNDVTEQHYFHELDKLEKELLEKCASNDNVLNEALDTYLLGLQTLHPGIQCSILENRDDRLFKLSAPGLPDAFLEAIEGAEIGENLGPCSLAAFLKQATIISNLQRAPLSEKFKIAAQKHHLKACWSHPILDGNGDVMATFACFSKHEREPSSKEKKTVKRVINILQVILESHRREQELKVSNARFEKATEATYDIIWDWDLATDSVYYSDNFNKLFGHKAGLHKDNIFFFSAHVHPEDLDKAILDPEEVKYGTMSRWSKEYRFKKACGEYAIVRDTAVVIRDENGIGTRVIGAAQDITKQRQEEQYLKLLQSVATNTTDAVLISEAKSVDDSGPRILYVNEAFTQMTGYTADEIIGKTPEILMGPKSDRAELKRLAKTVNSGLAFEGTIINYKKNGEEYWKHFSVVPVTNEHGLRTHLIAIERDVTEQKNRELQRTLMTAIEKVFAETEELQPALEKAVKHLACFGKFTLAEIWLTSTDKTHADLVAKTIKNDAMKAFYEESKNSKSMPISAAANGTAPELPPYVFWHHLGEQKLLRHDAAVKAGLKTAYVVPLKYDHSIVGILVLGSDTEEKLDVFYGKLFEEFGSNFGAVVRRKMLEDELNQVFNFTPDMLCILNTDGYFKKVNPAMCDILGYSAEELLSRPFTEFIHPADREKTNTELGNVIDGHPTYYLENRYITKSGKTKWLAWTSTGASEQGTIYCSAKDTTEKMELEYLLHKANTLARIGSWEVDVAKETIFWSDITREIHEAGAGYHPDIQNAIDFYLEGPDRDTVVGAMQDAISNGTPADVELRIITAKGNIKWVRVIIEAEFADGQCLRTYGSIQDIDARKRAEIHLKELNKSLENQARELAISNAELEQFAYVASHDLQEPLRMVTSFMTQLERKYADALDEKGRQYIHFAVDGAKRMREIILDLLDFSTVGNIAEDLEPVDFNKLIENIVALYRQQIMETGAAITFKNLPSIKTFKTPMRQIFQNLVGNSLKYHRTGVPPMINIGCTETAAHYHFSITDNGIGISPEFFDKIFIIFQRLHSKDEYSGTGMGLAITKKIIENLGGKIWVESAEGQGSTFHFTILKNPEHEVH
ncbi:MAG: PAS domain S-box protein [Mucilaginibacter sp.]